MNIQFKKGVLDMCVLSVIAEGDCYGYELVARISQNIEIAEGTIYPLLRKLQTEGYCETYLAESSGGPPRKYYCLTPAGRAVLNTLKEEWIHFSKNVDTILFQGGK
ncbi:MAG TPA: PadR family transcriptional regulator [bacterium]|nr:PadR family transcriptional regulator [bacterium]HPS30503.1 PadR family transcriptional regulator [bacterium]